MRRHETVILALWATYPTVMVMGGERVTRGKTARHMAHGKTNEDHEAEVAWQKDAARDGGAVRRSTHHSHQSKTQAPVPNCDSRRASGWPTRRTGARPPSILARVLHAGGVRFP